MLTTIGYEGATLADFIRTLEVAGVDEVHDIRERAQSRRRGFSKTALATALGDVGIQYRHFRELGDPKEGREAARANQIAKFQKIFLGVLQTQPAKDAMDVIGYVAQSKTVALLCYERSHEHCHRKLVADRIQELTGLAPRHLGVQRFEQAKQPIGRMPDFGQGATT